MAEDVRAAREGYLQLSADAERRLINATPIQQLYHVEEEPFARGKYAAVRRCRPLSCGRGGGWLYAAKFLRKWRRATDLRPEILHEVAILHACRQSPRVVSLHGVFESEHEMVLLLELAEGGELQSLLDRDIVPEEAHVRALMRQILLGLSDLHAINVAHLDIKPQNLVLTGPFPQSCEVKLCDLGISRYVGEGADIRDMMGTPDYVAPEVLNYEPISLATDMWSVGVLLYVLLTGCSPFGGDSKQETFCNISQCLLDFPDDLFEDVSEEAKDLMRKLMVKEPSQRLTVVQSLEHPWFSVALGSQMTLLSSSGASADASKGLDQGLEGLEKSDSAAGAGAAAGQRVKLEKSSAGAWRKLERPSPTPMRKPGKEMPEGFKHDDSSAQGLSTKRLVPVTRDANTPVPSKKTILTVEETTKQEEHNTQGETTEKVCGMTSFRKTNFKKNMGSILERVTSCEDFESNNSISLSKGNDLNSKVKEQSKIFSRSKSENNSISSLLCGSNSGHRSDDSCQNAAKSSSECVNESCKFSLKLSCASTCASVLSIPSVSSIASTSTFSRNRATSVQTMHLGSVRDFKLKFEPQPSVTASVPVSACVSSAAAKGSCQTLSYSFNKSTPSAAPCTPLGLTTVSTTPPTPTPTLTLTPTTTTTTSSCSVPRVSTAVAPFNTRTQQTEEKDCLYSFRKCFIMDDGENENGNSLVSDGTNESEASSGFYDNSSCCSSSDSVSDVSDTSGDHLGDRCSTASMDSLDSCYGKERRPFAATSLSGFSPRANTSKRVATLRAQVKPQPSQFHKAVCNFNKMLDSKMTAKEEATEQDKIFAAAKRHAAKAAHTTAIKAHTTVIKAHTTAIKAHTTAVKAHTTAIKAPKALVAITTPSPVIRKECALNITREESTGRVVLQEVKAGRSSKFNQVQIESVQSRIKKFQS